MASTDLTKRRPGNAALWLLPALLFQLFANGRNTIAVAAWLAPVFLLRFIRLQPARRGLPVAWLALTIAFVFQFRGMVPLPGVFYLVLAAVYGLVELLPFLIHRLVASRIRGFYSTLVLPTAWVTIEYLWTTFTPYGSWGVAAYSQHENLVLLQLLSITGLYGISFLIAWFAAVCNWIWESGFSWPQVSRGALTWATTFTVVLLFGGARLSLAPPAAPSVRVAGLTGPEVDLFPSPEVAQRASANQATEEEIAEIRKRADTINQDLLQRSQAAASAGARVIVWPESNAFVFKEDEPQLLRQGEELARTEGIYLGLAAGVWNVSAPRPLENKLTLIDADGTSAWQTLKAIPIPGPEANVSARDDGRIKVVDSPFGRIGGVICFDMDFPNLLAQAGRQEVDLLLVPSNDWQAIDPWHTHMARFRAVEQGFNMVRQVNHGLSVATDYQGRVLARMDHFTSNDRILMAQVPTRGVRTFYSRTGDSFAWLCAASLLAAVLVVWRKPDGWVAPGA